MRDAAQIWKLVQTIGVLDTNSPYAYLVLCSDFAASGAVAEQDGQIAGFVLGYRPPGRPEALFVWQVAVRDDHRGQGLARALLDWTMKRAIDDGASFLEATVTPSNVASRSLFQSMASHNAADCHEEMAFPSSLFPDGDHEAEVRIRIGPLKLSSDRATEQRS